MQNTYRGSDAYGGIKSAEASALELTDLTPLNIIQEYDYAANDWPGEFHHTAVNNNNNHIRLFSYYSWGGMTQSWEDYSDSWENTKSGTLATDISEGYYLSAVYDLGKIMRCRVYADMQISQSNDDLSWDNMQQAWEHYTLENNWSWFGSPEACGFEVQCSTSSDNQNWTEFIPLTSSFSHFRYVKFKVILKRFDAQYTPELQELTCTFDVPETIYNVDNFPVSSAGSTYIFPEPMQQKVIVIATIQSGAAGDQVQVNKSALRHLKCNTTLY
ncbi:hypothetical protein Psal073_03222 (plasmid) [Piscirickettsia salmonis]|nr:hypothetical protein Psal073_03222 [Piscirickettsia salmonis]